MKSVKYILTSIVGFTLVLGSVGMANANKYADYRDVVEATKGAGRSAEPVAWKHLNKFSRDEALKVGLEGTMLNAITPKEGPKNFRNNTTM